MAGASVRRVTALLAAVLLASIGSPSPVEAQDQAAVHLKLAGQTPWTTPRDPQLHLTVRATNGGDAALGDLSLKVTVFEAVRTRTAYESSLETDPQTGAVLTVPQAVDGALAAGATREFSASVDTRSLAAGGESLVYPVKVELQSAGVPVAALRTPEVFLVRQPETPLVLGWTFVLDGPLVVGPDGRFRSSDLEDAVAPGGRIAAETAALYAMAARPDAVPFDLALSPTLVLQLRAMVDGYAVVDAVGTVRRVNPGEGGAVGAANVLRQLAGLAGAEISALPFSAPSLPALEASGLGADVRVQLDKGRTFLTPLVGQPDPAVLRPPGGVVDRRALDALRANGVRVLLLDAGAVEMPAQPLGLAGPPTATLAAGGATVSAVAPDPGIEDLLSSPLTSQDPVLGAQAMLAELAVIWREQPSVERGLAMIVSEEAAPPTAIFEPLIRRISRAPWLQPVLASTLLQRFPPPKEPATLLVDGGPSFTRNYVELLELARGKIATWRSILVQPNPSPQPDPARLETQLLLAEARQFVGDERAGVGFVRAARRETTVALQAVGAYQGQEFILTSSRGTIPVRLHNDTPQPVRVVVQFASSHLSEGPARQIRLEPGDTTLQLDVEAKTAGVFQVAVVVKSPLGAPVSGTELSVRSTAYNRIALIITMGAGALLLLAWARRFLPRKTS